MLELTSPWSGALERGSVAQVADPDRGSDVPAEGLSDTTVPGTSDDCHR